MNQKILAALATLAPTSIPANAGNSVIACAFIDTVTQFEFVIKFGGSIGEGKALAIYRDKGEDVHTYPADLLRTDKIYTVQNLRSVHGGVWAA